MDLNRLLDPKTVKNYQNYLKSTGTPPATIDRKLSSLKKWQEFAQKNYLKKISSQIDKNRSEDIRLPARVFRPHPNPLAGLYHAAMAVFGYNQIFSQAHAGKAVLPAGLTEFTVYTPHFSGDTLTYVTPVGDSQNQVLYVKAKQGGAWFKVAVNQPLPYDLPFNWWMIRLN